MAWTFLIYGLVPLVAFVAVDFWAGLKWAVGAAVLFAIVDVLITYHFSGSWDPGSIIAAVLIMIFGALAAQKNSAIYVKLQPVAVGIVFALLLAYWQFFAGGVINRYLPLVQSALPESIQPLLGDVRFVSMLNQSITGLIGALLAHAAWVAYAAFKLNNIRWLLIRGAGLWLVFGIYAVGFALYQAISGSIGG